MIVTPNDGYQDGIPQELSVTIANSPPDIDSIEITTSVVGYYNDSEFTCSVEYSDWDEDEVSLEYSWQVNGSVLSTENPFVPTNGVVPGTELTCIVTASDGQDASVDSASVVIENRIQLFQMLIFYPKLPIQVMILHSI